MFLFVLDVLNPTTNGLGNPDNNKDLLNTLSTHTRQYSRRRRNEITLISSLWIEKLVLNPNLKHPTSLIINQTWMFIRNMQPKLWCIMLSVWSKEGNFHFLCTFEGEIFLWMKGRAFEPCFEFGLRTCFSIQSLDHQG